MMVPETTIADVTAIMRAQQVKALLGTAQAELVRLNRVTTLGQLTASIAHEIAQPIASARNNACAALNFLNRQSSDVSEVREALICVVADADRAGQIVDRIRNQTRRAPPRRDLLDLNDAVKEVIVLVRNEIANNRISLHTTLADGQCPVHGDRVQLQQVVMNLILNAIEAMSSVEVGAREMSVSTEERRTGDVLVAVRDSGPGIEPEHLNRVFDAFYTTKPGGVGMGLAICQSIIDAHEGRLWAKLVEPRGALFQFTLPTAQCAFIDSSS